MRDRDLRKKLTLLGQKIQEAREKRAFKAHLHNGHRLTMAKLGRHYKETHYKIKADIHDYKKKLGHLNVFEEQLILFMNSID